jgi:virulence factor Mce-like protein
MNGLTSRVGTNVLVVLVLSILLVLGAFLTYASGVVFDDSYEVQVALPEAGGVLPDQQVTVMGRSVGQVADVEVTADGVLLTLRIHGDQRVPDPADATVLRRSPIGEQAVDLAPTTDDWRAAERDSVVATEEITVAPEVAGLLDETVDLFENIEVDDVSVLVEELAVALDGRGDRLRRLGRDSLDLNRTLVAGIPEFERLLDASEATLAMLQEQRDTLRSAIASGADLTEVFAGQRGNVEALLDSGTPALEQLDAFLLNTRANIGCLMSDLTNVNEMLLGPSTYTGANDGLYSSKLEEFERALATQHFFFEQGFSLVAQPDLDTGLLWLRVLLVVDAPQSAEFYDELRPTPATTPGEACVSDEFGRGVDAVRQEGVQEAHETAPGIAYGESVPATHDRVQPDDSGANPRGEQVDPASGAQSDTDLEVPDPTPETEDDDVELLTGAPGELDEPGSRLGPLVAGAIAALGLGGLGWAAWWLRRDRSRS